MKMIQLTNQSLGLVIIAAIDMRSIQHQQLLGREDLIPFEGEDILELEMPHPTSMKFSRGLHVPVEQLLKVSAMLLYRADMLDDGITGDMLLERFLLCLNNDFHSEVFNVDHYRNAVHSILDSWTVSYFTKAQIAEVKRRMSLAQKRRWRLLSLEARKGHEVSLETRLAMSKTRKGRKFTQSHRDALSKAHKGHKKTQAIRDAIVKAKTKYHYRITNLDTKTILMEDCTLNEICDSNLGVKYNEPKSKSSFYTYLRTNLKGDECSTSLNVSDVEYRVEKYLVTK